MFWFGLILGIIAGGVAVAFFLNNIHSSKVKALEDKIKGFTQGVVRKGVPVLILLSLLASCNTKDYHNKITGRYISTQYRTTPMNDSIRDVIKRGLIHVDSSHAGNPLYYDSLFRVAFTQYQNWQSGHKGFLFSGITVFLVFVLIFIVVTSKYGKKTSQLLWLVPAFFLGGPLIGAFYYYSPEKEISKRDYVYYTTKDNGSLEEWWTNGFKPAPTYTFLKGDALWIDLANKPLSGGSGVVTSNLGKPIVMPTLTTSK